VDVVAVPVVCLCKSAGLRLDGSRLDGEGDPVGASERVADKGGVGAIAAEFGIETTRVRLKGFVVEKDRPTPPRLRTLSDGLFDVEGSAGAKCTGWRDGLVGPPGADRRESEFGAGSFVPGGVSCTWEVIVGERLSLCFFPYQLVYLLVDGCSLSETDDGLIGLAPRR
jgi:hypothetical protein